MEKQNDYFLSLLNNPTFSADDFNQVGLSVDNTSIQDKDIYRNSNYIQSLDVFKTNGTFDQAKFDNFYDYAKNGFVNLAKIKETDDLGKTWRAYRNDISMPEYLRDKSPQYNIQKVSNPLRQQSGFVDFGLKENPTQSIREIAQTQKVWNPDTNTWEEAPNETPFDNFLNPKILATWDEDGVHKDPITGEEVEHKKGERKLNSNGTYYYEDLNGRDVYGKEVLSGFDTLTTDGSSWNGLDFLDSDDIEKSTGGSLMRAAAQIIPAFIPGVGEWYIAVRVGLGMSQILPSVGKTLESFIGTDIGEPVFNRLEAWDKAFSFSQSDYTQGSQGANGDVLQDAHLWSAETGFKLIADVFTQLAEQRWMFEKSASLFSGLNKEVISSKEAQNKWIEDYIAKNSDKAGSIDEIIEGISKGITPEAAITTQKSINFSKAQKVLQDKLKGANDLGSKLSMAYMTGITTASSYGEAKEAGATDIEAALFSLGYTLGEWKLLNLELGKWILPELKSEERHIRNVINKAMPKVKEVTSNSDTKTELGKLKWYQKLFDLGKKAYNNNLGEGVGSEALGSTISNMASEALEETSEELLQDVAKTFFNIATSLGSGAKFDDNFENVFDRYALSFLGGAVGGGIAGYLPAYRSARFDRTMSQEAATKELVDIIQQGKDKELLSTMYKMNFGNKYLDEQGNQTDDVTKSQDYAIKQNFEKLVTDIKDILKVNGADLTRDSMIEGFRDDLKYGMLATLASEKSNSIEWYLNRYNELSSQLVQKSLDLKSIQDNKTDKQKREEGEDSSEKEKKLKEEIKGIKEELDKFKDGTMSDEFILDALFEMTSKISGEYVPTDPDRWIEQQSGKAIDELSAKEYDDWKKKYEDSKPLRRDLTRMARQIHIKNMEKLSGLITKYNDSYFDNPNFVDNLNEVLFGARKEALADEEITIPSIEEYLHLRNDSINLLLNNLQQIILGNMEKEKAQPYLDKIKGIISQKTKASEVLGKDLPTTPDELRSSISEFQDHDILTKDADAYIEKRKNEETGAEYEVLNNAFRTEVSSFEKEQRQFQAADFNQQLKEFLMDDDVKKELKKMLSSAKYILPTVKQALNDFFNSNISILDEESGDIIEVPLLSEADAKEYMDSYKNVPSSPVDEYLNGVTKTLKSKGIEVSPLVSDMEALVSKLAKARMLNNFSYDDKVEKAIDDALSVIRLAKVGLESAATSINGDLSDVFGYNVSVNEIRAKRGKAGQQLATIPADVAVGIQQDINRYEQELLLFKQVQSINSNEALNEHDKTYRTQSINLLNGLKTFVGHIEPGDWNEVDQLKKAVEESSISELTEDDIINQEYKEKITNARMSLDRALHNFFRANKDVFEYKTKEDKEKSIKKLQTLLKDIKIVHKFDSDGTSTILNSEEKSYPHKDLLWNLASAAAVNPDAVMYEYQEVITSQYAPIIGQEEAIKTALSFLINPKVFNLFADAYNANLMENDQDDKGYSYINARRSIFIEGLPGSGKSSAVLKTLTDILDKFHPKLLEKVVIVSNSKENAETLKNNLQLEKAQHFGIEEFRQKIMNNYVPFNVDKDGRMEVSSDDVEFGDDGIYRYKKATLNPDGLDASLIIIDEATSLSQMDAAMVDDFMKAKGIYGVYAGDFDQLGASGALAVSKDKSVLITQDAGNYISTHKLGQIVRGNNIYKSNNTVGLRLNKYKFIDSLLSNGKSITPTIFSYYQDEKGLFGDVIASSDKKTTASGSTFDLDTDTKNKIKLMIDTLNEGEKINFIYDDPNSEMYKYLHNNYADKINEISTKAAQSQEGQYYIVDIGLSTRPTSDVKDYIAATNQFKTLYTAISRAKQATLIYERQGSDEISKRIQSHQMDKLVKSNIGQESRKKYADSRKKAIQAGLNGTSITAQIDWSEEKFGEKKNPEPEPEEETEDEKIDIRNNPKPVDIDNDSEDSLNMLIHTFNTNECGGYIDEDGLLVLGEKTSQRIDNVHGILKALNIKKADGTDYSEGDKLSKEHTKQILSILHKTRTAGLYEKTPENVVAKVREAFGLRSTDSVSVNFIYKNTQNEDIGVSGGPLMKLFRGIKDKLMYLFNKNSNEKIEKPQKRTFGLEIFINGKQIEIPIGILTSPATLVKTKGFEQLNDIFVNSGENLMNFHQELIRRKDEPIPHIKSMLKLLEIYQWNYSGHNTNDQNFVIRFNKDFVLNSGKLTGVQTPPKTRGSEYFDKDYLYEGQRLSLAEYREKMPNRKISQVLENLKEDIKDAEGNIVLEHGIPFVLVSDYYSNMTDTELFEKYIEQISNKDSEPLITRVYVYLPKESVDYFLYNQQEALRGNEDETSADDIDKSIGNMLTSYRLLSFMTKEGSKYQEAFEDWISNNTDTDKQKDQARKRFQRVKDIMKYLDTYEKSLVPSASEGSPAKQLLSFLNQSLDNLKTVDSELYRMFIPTSDSGMIGYGNKSLRTILQYEFRKLLFSENLYESKNSEGRYVSRQLSGQDYYIERVGNDYKYKSYQQNRIDALKEDLESNGWTGIMFHSNLKKDTEISSRGYKVAQVKAEDGSFLSDKTIDINGKLDTTAIVVDIEPIMDEILSKLVIKHNDGRIVTSQKLSTLTDSAKISIYNENTGAFYEGKERSISSDPIQEKLKQANKVLTRGSATSENLKVLEEYMKDNGTDVQFPNVLNLAFNRLNKYPIKRSNGLYDLVELIDVDILARIGDSEIYYLKNGEIFKASTKSTATLEELQEVLNNNIGFATNGKKTIQDYINSHINPDDTGLTGQEMVDLVFAPGSISYADDIIGFYSPENEEMLKEIGVITESNNNGTIERKVNTSKLVLAALIAKSGNFDALEGLNRSIKEEDMIASFMGENLDMDKFNKLLEIVEESIKTKDNSKNISCIKYDV